MSREAIIFLLGICVIIVPFLGVPTEHKEYALIVLGGSIAVCGYSLRRSAFLREIEKDDGERVADSFSESNPLEKT